MKGNYYKTALVALNRIPDGKCAEPFVSEVIDALSKKLAYKKMELLSHIVIAGLMSYPLTKGEFEKMYRDFISKRDADEVIMTTSYIEQVRVLLNTGFGGQEKNAGDVK